VKKILCVFVVLLLFVSVVSCAKKNDEQQVENYAPLMWRVVSPSGQEMYMFGSIHVGNEGLYPLPAYVMEAFAWADYLAVEVDVLAFMADIDRVIAFEDMLLYTDGRTAVDDLGDALYAQISAIFAQVGVPWGWFDEYVPHIWSEMLLEISLMQAGLDTEYGIDIFFIEEAYIRQMPVIEIETAEGQFEMMLGFSLPLQIFLLQDAADNFDQGAAYITELFETWKRGDYAMLNHMLKQDYGDMPAHLLNEYMTAMLTERDINMAAAARRYMADGLKVFYVVGAAHLIGDGSVIDILRSEGYSVEIVRK
jgi:hypothetical protein